MKFIFRLKKSFRNCALFRRKDLYFFGTMISTNHRLTSMEVFSVILLYDTIRNQFGAKVPDFRQANLLIGWLNLSFKNEQWTLFLASCQVTRDPHVFFAIEIQNIVTDCDKPLNLFKCWIVNQINWYFFPFNSNPQSQLNQRETF